MVFEPFWEKAFLEHELGKLSMSCAGKRKRKPRWPKIQLRKSWRTRSGDVRLHGPNVHLPDARAQAACRLMFDEFDLDGRTVLGEG